MEKKITPEEAIKAAQALIDEVSDQLTPKLHYLKGDATKPIKPEATGPQLIAHVCNDAQRWGAGFTKALEEAFPGSGNLFVGTARKLGDLHVLEVSDNPEFKGDVVLLLNMVAQHGLISTHNPRPLDYMALEACMHKVAAIANGLSQEPGVFPPTIHCPRFGTGLAGGDWKVIEPLIHRLWVEAGFDVYVYDLS